MRGHKMMPLKIWLVAMLMLLVRNVNCQCNVSFDYSQFSSDIILCSELSCIDGSGQIWLSPTAHRRSEDGFMFGVLGAFYKRSFILVDSVSNPMVSFATTFEFSTKLSDPKATLPMTNGVSFVILPEYDVSMHTSDIGSMLLGPFHNTWSSGSGDKFAVQFHTYLPEAVNSNVGFGVPATAEELEMIDSLLSAGNVSMVSIVYDATTHQLQVRLGNSSSGGRQWTLFSQRYDLSAMFLNPVYVGFYSPVTASIHSWNFSSSSSCEQCCGFKGPVSPFYSTSLQRNRRLQESTSRQSTTDNRVQRASKSPNRFILFIVVSCITVVAVLLVVLSACRLYRVWFSEKKPTVPPRYGESYGARIFTYKELSVSTNGFDASTLLGRGGAGSVYKGSLVEYGIPKFVAVKRTESEDKQQGERQFIAEVSSIGRLNHSNLVKLVGWCHEKGELLLVYEYMPNGSLDRLLFLNTEDTLSWESRFIILKGVASALNYLHEGSDKQVVHRDVKASNVLLDRSFNACLGDFGLARFVDRNKISERTPVSGTWGYLAPEITKTGKATCKSDVFSFGALALEVTCGRRPLENTLPPNEVVLVDWIWRQHSKGELLNTVDARLQRGTFEVGQVSKVLIIGLLCSHPDPDARPTMANVVRMFRDIDTVVCPPVPPYDPASLAVLVPPHYRQLYSPVTMEESKSSLMPLVTFDSQMSKHLKSDTA